MHTTHAPPAILSWCHRVTPLQPTIHPPSLPTLTPHKQLAQPRFACLTNTHARIVCRYCGYEVTTEGDSFTIAFHDAFDATAWALHVQTALLNAAWPEALLSHPRAATVYSTEMDSSRPGQLLFRGLRVRAAINTGASGRFRVRI